MNTYMVYLRRVNAQCLRVVYIYLQSRTRGKVGISVLVVVLHVDVGIITGDNLVKVGWKLQQEVIVGSRLLLHYLPTTYLV